MSLSVQSPVPESPDEVKSTVVVYVPLGVTFHPAGQATLPAAHEEATSYPPTETHCPLGLTNSRRRSPAQLLPPLVFVKTRFRSIVVNAPVASKLVSALCEADKEATTLMSDAQLQSNPTGG